MAPARIPADMRKMSWSSRDRRSSGFFNPVGKIGFSDEMGKRFRENPVEWSTDKLLSARMIVGFNIGLILSWSMEDLIALVKEIRTRQKVDPDATFVYQKGMYTYSESGTVTEEEGGQVIIFKFDASITDDDFQRQMVEMAEEVCKKFEQKAVVLEIQRGGISQMTGMVTP